MTYEELTKHLEDSSFDEGQFIDFKAEIEQKKEYDLAKDISSFANAQGGRIFIGIKNNKEFKNDPIYYPIKSWEYMDSEDLSNQTRNKLSNLLGHGLHFTVNPVKIPNKNYPVLIIEISKSATICGYRKTPSSSYEFWHRIDRQNVPMGIAQIIDKSLGSHHHEEQLIISREFANLLIQRMALLCSAIHLSYGNNGKSQLTDLIHQDAIKKMDSSIEQIVYMSEIAYTNLASLAFLSANIRTDLKQLSMTLINKIAKITQPASIWRCNNGQLESYKKLKDTSQFNPLLNFLDASNELIIDYQSLLKIKRDIDEKIAHICDG